MNKQIRLNNNYNDKKICYNFKLIENLTLQDINYRYFFRISALLNAITDAIGTSGKMSVQEWASIGKALGIYTDKI